MKYLRKYWPVLLLAASCLALVLVLILVPGNSVPISDGDGFEPEDPESVVVDKELSDAKSNLGSDFVETTDEITDTNSQSSDSNAAGDESIGSTDNSPNQIQSQGGNSSDASTNSSVNNGDEPSDPEEEAPPPPPKNNISDEAYEDVQKARTKFTKMPKTVEVNGVLCAYEEETNTYIYSISTRNIDQEAQYCLTGTYEDEDLYFSFEEDAIGTDGMFIATGNDTLNLAVFNDEEYVYCKLRISSVPILVLETENRKPLPTSDKNTNYLCTLTLQDPDADIHGGSEYLASYATVHLRGASSLTYPKKSLKVELQKFTTDEDGNELMVERKKPLLGMRDDDDWILDANYIDPTMMHNYLSYNLWETIGGTSNPDGLMAGPSCEYVEVILNGKYHGLYLLVEPVDEKQMGVQRTEDTADGSHGVYIKTTSWSGTKFNEISGKPGTGKTWMGFEIKYPETGITSSDWQPLYDLLNATAGLHTAVTNNDKQLQKYVDHFKEVASEHLSKENIVNYWILISVTLARDNAGKNIHWSIPNTSAETVKMYINAWDMDNSFGYRYGAASTGPIKDPVDTANYADKWFVLLKYYIEYDVDGAKSYLKNRWAELTMAGEPCSITSLRYKIENTANYLVQSGAFEREQSRWPQTSSYHASCPNSMETELEYILNWIEGRIPVVDKIVKDY